MSNNVYGSDRVTSMLIRRVLCPQHLQTSDSHAASQARPSAKAQLSSPDEPAPTSSDPTSLSELLPPLTSSNSVDLQLYALLAIFMKDFVYPWYGKITNDTHFVEEVVRVVAHVTRALESRTRNITQQEWERFTLGEDGLAGILNTHIDACRVVHKAATVTEPDSFYAHSIYHSLRPHPALSPVPDQANSQSIRDQLGNDTSYRKVLAQGLLAVLLPTEDLLNPCLRALTSEAIGDLVLGHFIGFTFCEPQFIYRSLATAADTLRSRRDMQAWASSSPEEDVTSSNLVPSTVAQVGWRRFSISGTYRALVQYYTLAMMSVRGVLALIAVSGGLPKRRSSSGIKNRISEDSTERPGHASWAEPTEDTMIQPLISYHAWAATANLLSLAMIMPWFHGFLSLIHWIGVYGKGFLCGTDSHFDRLLSHWLTAPFKDPDLLPIILLNLRVTLFPGNTIHKSPASSTSSTSQFATPPVSIPPNASVTASVPTNPSPSSTVFSSSTHLPDLKHDHVESLSSSTLTEDIPSSRRKAALALLNLFPEPLARIYLLGSPTSNPISSSAASKDSNNDIALMLGAIERNILYIFDDAYMNKHLMYAVLELCIAMVLPELGDVDVVAKLRGREYVDNEEVGLRVTELLRRRGVDVDGDGN